MANEDNETNPVGRPSKYNDDTKGEINRRVYELALLGLTDKQIAPVLGIVESTLNEWKNKFPEFSESIKKGKIIADAEVAKSFYKVAKGYTSLEVSFKEANLSEGLLVGFDLENMSPYDMLNLGQLLKVKDASVKIKELPPDSRAALLWLSNRQRGLWRVNPDNEPEEDPLEDTPIVYQFITADGEYIDMDSDLENPIGEC